MLPDQGIGARIVLDATLSSASETGFVHALDQQMNLFYLELGAGTASIPVWLKQYSGDGVQVSRGSRRVGVIGGLLLLGMTSIHSAHAEQVTGTSWAASVRAALARQAAHGLSAAHVWTEKGVASWYAGRFTHHRTASGTRFDPAKLTAAHPTAPLGSKLLVKSEETGQSVVVTVNDRGPYGRGRIIDLSQAAASRLGMLGAGTAHVSVSPAPADFVEVAEAPQEDGLQNAASGDTSASDDSAETQAPLVGHKRAHPLHRITLAAAQPSAHGKRSPVTR